VKEEEPKMVKKTYGAEFKAKVALAAIKGKKITRADCFQVGLHPGQVRKWKRQIL
jgi:transposase-like protein